MINVYELYKWIRINKSKIDGSIIKKIYKTYEGIILELYKKDLDKKYLYLIKGKFVFLSNKKINLETDNFVMRLRKDFEGKKIQVDMFDFERVFVVSLNDSSKKMLVELFSEGNIIVVNKENIIEYALIYKDYGIRKIKREEAYKIPGKEFRIPKDLMEFRNIIKNSNKKDIVRTLAIDLRLGGKYAELFLSELKINKNKKPDELTETEIKALWQKYIEFLNKDLVYFGKWINVNEAFEKFIEYIENYEINKIKEKRKKISEILEKQKKELEEMKKKREIYIKIGEFLKQYYWIFEGYDINKIKRLLKEIGFDVKIEDKGNKIILDINL